MLEECVRSVACVFVAAARVVVEFAMLRCVLMLGG